MIRAEIVLAAAAAAGFLAACSPPGWMVGSDNGEAYEAYTKAMEEAGIPPEKW